MSKNIRKIKNFNSINNDSNNENIFLLSNDNYLSLYNIYNIDDLYNFINNIINNLDDYSKSILINNNSNFVYLHLSEDLLETYNIVDVFNSIQNKIILISSGDIDFPPPKKPYSYHKYFDKSKLFAAYPGCVPMNFGLFSCRAS